MKKRIGSRLYDTETAVCVGKDKNGDKIYRKRNGEYFIARDGTIEILAVDDVPNRNAGGEERTRFGARIKSKNKAKLLKIAADQKINVNEALDQIIEGVNI